MVNKKLIVKSIAVPLAGGMIIGYLTSKNNVYLTLKRPPLAPPPVVFPIVWCILYIMMGVAFYLMYTSSSDKEQKNKSKRVYASQLILNFLWPVLFFSLKAFWAAALCLVFLILMLIKTYKEFKISDNRAALLLIPYMAWCFFALYLNIGIAILN